MKKDMSTYVRLVKEAIPYWRIAAVAMLAMTVTAGLEPILPALMARLIDESLIAQDPDALLTIPFLIVGVFVLKGIAEYVASVSSQYVAHRTVADIRSQVFAVQLDLPMEEHGDEEGGRMLSRITYDVAQVGEAVSTAWMVIIKDTLMILGLLGFLIYTSWQLSLALLIAAPIVHYVVKKAAVKMRRSNEDLQTWTGRLTGLVEESLMAIRDIKIFGGHRSQQAHFDDINRRLRQEQMRVVKIQSLNVPLVQILAALTIGIVIVMGTQMSVRNLLSPGEFIAYITAMGMIFDPVRRLTGVNATIQRGLAAAESIYAIFDHALDDQRHPAPHYTPLPEASLEFDHISFQYPGQSELVLSDVSLRIATGETLALIGPSGSGKSSLLALIAGFIQPVSGAIRINGIAIADWPLAQRRRQLSLVGQQVNLFDTTIEANIRFGDPDASFDAIYDAARKAHALDFIEALPDGFQTRIGPFGNRLSGGQRPRLAIARAFLKDAPILLLDEPTSALDADARDHVLAGLENLKQSRTTLVISHQPETLLSVDRILELDRGHLRSPTRR